MQRLEASCAVRLIYTSLCAKGLTGILAHSFCSVCMLTCTRVTAVFFAKWVTQNVFCQAETTFKTRAPLAEPQKIYLLRSFKKKHANFICYYIRIYCDM